MKVVYPICCGVDAHLDFVQQSIAKLDEKLDKMVKPFNRFKRSVGIQNSP